MGLSFVIRAVATIDGEVFRVLVPQQEQIATYERGSKIVSTLTRRLVPSQPNICSEDAYLAKFPMTDLRMLPSMDVPTALSTFKFEEMTEVAHLGQPMYIQS